MLSSYFEKAMNLYRHFDGLVAVDTRGIIKYYRNNRQDYNKLIPNDVIGRHVTEVWPELTPETSTLLSVLKTKEPILNFFQEYTNFRGVSVKAINSTLPITDARGELIGAIDVSVYVSNNAKNTRIDISSPITQDNLYHLNNIITNDYHMLQLKDSIERIASTNSSVMICGETGTGKELFAQSIHTSSGRCNGPFVAQNCSAIPNTLLESLLFGTVKGAYTGAENRKGIFELADGGTIFLDEINSMDVNMQSKILRVLEERKLKRVGGEKEIKFNVRIISAVNENPLDFVSRGTMRTDLYYRLSPVQLTIPPLRERPGDIPLLVNFYINQFNKTMHRNVSGVSESAMAILMRHAWKGNVRELKNVVEGWFNLSPDGILSGDALPSYLLENQSQSKISNGEGFSLAERVGAFEKGLILDALEKNHTLSSTAKALNVTRQNLRYKLEKYNIDIGRFAR